ncbi:hypothetical protein BMETH_1516_0 [methanotrophic bacterial endosymbiont of Bathymodiolus sp.]|nr:hypothetical protein BMETH_1516_0 [methanotrophic bacterial endosymbiont of Bathymodiolus sp.]
MVDFVLDGFIFNPKPIITSVMVFKINSPICGVLTKILKSSR